MLLKETLGMCVLNHPNCCQLYSLKTGRVLRRPRLASRPPCGLARLRRLRTVLAPGGIMYLVCYRRTDHKASGKATATEAPPPSASPSEGAASSGPSAPAARDRASARCISHWVSDELSGMGVLAHECAASCAETSHLCVLRCFVDDSTSTPPVHEQHVPVGAADPAAMGLACSALAGCDLSEDVD